MRNKDTERGALIGSVFLLLVLFLVFVRHLWGLFQ